MKAKLKKALAMLLALCLAVSLAPMALAMDTSNCVMLDVPWDYIEQCGNQHDSGNTSACQCYCWAYCKIILDNKVHTWEEYRDGDSGQTAKAPSAAGYESATNTASKQTLLEAVYDNINIGRPVVLRCKGSVNYHFTVAIGYKADCDPSNLNESDIIILNPSQGTVQTLADVTLKTSKNKYGYWITNSGGANVITTEKVPTTITFNSLNTPSTTVGKSTNITGTITSTGSKIKSIKAVVTDSSGNTKLSKTVSSLSTYSYTLKKSALDKGLTFGKLSEGSYTLKYTVTTADGTTDTKNTTVTVQGTQTNITFDSLNSPSVTEGKATNITGTIKSTGSKIQSIKAVVTDSSGNTKLSKTVSSINAYSYTLKKSALDKGLSFAKLSAGDYTLKYTVTTADGTSATKSVSVTVKAAETTITFNSLNNPSTKAGKATNITGTIKSTGSKIQSIKAVVTDSSGNTKLSKTVSSLSTNSYTLKRSALDMGLSFSKLSAGSYTLKYTVTTADGTTANKSVSVTVK